MKAKKNIRLLTSFLIISILSIHQSCSERNETVSCFPNSVISVTINLTLPAYYDLQTVGTGMYIDEQQSGTRGLIVVKTASGYRAYDRNAPHLCPDKDTTLEIVNGTTIVCPKDGSKWILITGQPTDNSPAKTAPKTYFCNVNGNFLNISN